MVVLRQASTSEVPTYRELVPGRHVLHAVLDGEVRAPLVGRPARLAPLVCFALGTHEHLGNAALALGVASVRIVTDPGERWGQRAWRGGRVGGAPTHLACATRDAYQVLRVAPSQQHWTTARAELMRCAVLQPVRNEYGRVKLELGARRTAGRRTLLSRAAAS